MSDSLIVLHTSIAIIAIVLPILVALLLVAFGTIAEAAGLKSPVVTFFGDPVFALFVGLLGAYLLAYVAQRAGRGSDERWLRRDGPDPADHRPRRLVGSGDHRDRTPGYPRRVFLGGGTPVLLTVLLAWLIAAVLHLAIGSISVAAITASGIPAPIMDGPEVPAVIMALAIGSGALFALQVTATSSGCSSRCLGSLPREPSQRLPS